MGQIDDNNTGISGLEKSLDKILKNNSEPVKLTVDEDIQFLVKKRIIQI